MLLRCFVTREVARQFFDILKHNYYKIEYYSYSVSSSEHCMSTDSSPSGCLPKKAFRTEHSMWTIVNTRLRLSETDL